MCGGGNDDGGGWEAGKKEEKRRRRNREGEKECFRAELWRGNASGGERKKNGEWLSRKKVNGRGRGGRRR